MWELDYEESWALKNWCFWSVVLEMTLERPLDCKEIQPVHPKEISSGCSLEGLMLKLKLQYFGHLMQRSDSWSRRWAELLGGKLCSQMRGKGRCGWLGRKCWWKPSSCVGSSLFLYHQLRQGRGRKGAGKSLFSCVSVPVFKLIFDDFAYPYGIWLSLEDSWSFLLLLKCLFHILSII